jgi:chromosome segregation protein
LYLKKLNLVGFKSFADKTDLVFEPGMTAIVGPNGCGKSNASDAIRWVLGEQSAKAMRGGQMTDVIFSGTDSQKALNMAEVSITLADCEEALGTEYNEVTITRRVHRSGESQYYKNKELCRLKDIQRLFMDTGIGKGSYSILEQGKIDQILSSRPEDRRLVFEEASGISKYKADKKITMRRLEQTDANLLRADDIIREQKRRILALQRQAGKARRYRTIQSELRGFDLYLNRKRLKHLDEEIFQMDKRIKELTELVDTRKEDVEQTEQKAAAAREELANTETTIAASMESTIRLRNEFEGTRSSVQVNRDRIAELEAYANRDSKDAEDAQARLSEHRKSLEEQQDRLKAIQAERDAAQATLRESLEAQKTIDEQAQRSRSHLASLRQNSIKLDDRNTQLHNELSEYDARERSSVIRKERLAAEQEESANKLTESQARLKELEIKIAELRSDVETKQQLLDDLLGRRKTKGDEIAILKTEMGKLEQQRAGLRTRVEMLTVPEGEDDAFPGGARMMMLSQGDGVDRSGVVGALAEMFSVDAEYQVALESVLRTWLDAVVVEDIEVARTFLTILRDRKEGAARILSANLEAPRATESTAGVALIDHVTFDPKVTHLAHYLIGSVRVVETFDQLELGDGYASFVTRDGAILRGDGTAEFWMSNEQQGNPLARKQMREKAEKELEALQTELSRKQQMLDAMLNEDSSSVEAVQEARDTLGQVRRELAQQEGEQQVLVRTVKQAQQQAEKASVELNALMSQESSTGDQRTKIADQIECLRTEQSNTRSEINAREKELENFEKNRSQAGASVTEKRIQFAELSQQADHVTRQQESLQERVRELETLIKERSEGVSSYKSRVENLANQIKQAEDRLGPLELAVTAENTKLEELRQHRANKQKMVEESDRHLREQRAGMDTQQAERNKLEIRAAEQKVRRQGAVDRLSEEYQISEEQLFEEPDPEWEGDQPPPSEELETLVAELKSKLDAMGAVNLVAIEELQELEDLYQFQVHQQEDLIKGKQQLLEMIKKIEKESTERFVKTFEQVNINFQMMFQKLFGGGTAKLVLVDENDVLECGIDIIARPPGKKLQTVSLLSGGERTMTAVGLLFSLYMVKPSPFCVLDELDAALDDANIGRFVAVVKEFVAKSQFIVITHNQQTITAADVLYGVTMQQKGVSKIVSVKLTDHDKTPKETAKAK